MSVEYKVVENGKVVELQANGVWRDQKNHRLYTLPGSVHQDFDNKNFTDVLDEEFQEVVPGPNVVWVGR